MAVLTEIRNRPWLLMGVIALALLAFLVNPDSLDKMFGKNPDVLGKVNGEKITREEYNDQLYVLQMEAEQQGQPKVGLEEKAWQILVQSKLIKQEFEKMGFEMTDDFFWSQLQYDPMFAQNSANFDEKGNFRLQEIKKQVEDLQAGGNPEMLNSWLKTKKTIEYRMMARQVFANVGAGITASKKEAEQMMKFRDNMANINFVKVDFMSFLQKNPIKVTTEDLKNYIEKHPVMFKSDASRNLGIVYFPAKASPEDEAKTLAELNKLYNGEGENFMNTPNDSLFVMANSDMPYNHTYLNPNQLPRTIQSQVASASVGQVFGPYKEQHFYVVSKLVGKKPSDSTLSRHILISYKGNQAAQGETRSKEEAKKLADSIGAIIKANPSRFTEFVKLSADSGSATQGGSLGWTTPDTPFVPEFLKFLANNPKGAVGVVETQFGYHIINIEDKKSGAMTYKVANLVKAIKPSDKTTTLLDRNAKKFIQQVQGKSFNDFVNIAKKGNYNFLNPKAVKRFEGQIPGLNSEKAEDILSWAFDKKRSKGDTELFTDEGTGDKIVVYLNGKQEKGLADPESVREQIEATVKNQLAAKKIIEKITAAKATSLDKIASLFGVAKETAQVNLLNPMVGNGIEPKVAGAAFGIAKGKLSNPIEGLTGVYVLVKQGETTNKLPGDVKDMTQTLTRQYGQYFGSAWLKSLQDNAKIEDYRIEIWNKLKAMQ